MDTTKRVARSAGVAGVTLLLVGGAAMGGNAIRHNLAPSSGAPVTLDEPTEAPEAAETAEPTETPEPTEKPDAKAPAGATDTDDQGENNDDQGENNDDQGENEQGTAVTEKTKPTPKIKAAETREPAGTPESDGDNGGDDGGDGGGD
jgi:hypothetical protein